LYSGDETGEIAVEAPNDGACPLEKIEWLVEEYMDLSDYEQAEKGNDSADPDKC